MQHDSDKEYLVEFQDLADLLTSGYEKAENLGTQIAADVQSSAENIQRIDQQLAQIRELRSELDAKISEAIKGAHRINAEHQASLEERRELKRIDDDVQQTLERLKLYHTEDAGFVIPGVDDLPDQIAKLKQQCEDQQSSIDRVHERLDEFSREDSIQDALLELRDGLASMSVDFDEKLSHVTNEVSALSLALTQVKRSAITETTLPDKVNSEVASQLETATPESKQLNKVIPSKGPENLKGGMYGEAVSHELGMTSNQVLSLYSRLKIIKTILQQISGVEAQLIQEYIASDKFKSISVPVLIPEFGIPPHRPGITKRDVADATGLRVTEIKECARKSGFGTVSDNAEISANQYTQLTRRIEIDHRMKRLQPDSVPQPALASLAVDSTSTSGSGTSTDTSQSLDSILETVDSGLDKVDAPADTTVDSVEAELTDERVEDPEQTQVIDEELHDLVKEASEDEVADGSIGSTVEGAEELSDANSADAAKEPKQLDDFVDRIVQQAHALMADGEFTEAIDVLAPVYDSTEELGLVERRIEILRLIIACLAQSEADGPIQAYEFFQSEIDQFLDSPGQIGLLLDIARVLRQMDDFDKCIDVLKQAVHAQERLDHGPIITPVQELCEVLLAADQPTAAYEVANKASERILEAAEEVDPEYGLTDIGSAFGLQIRALLAQGYVDDALAKADEVNRDSRFSEADRAATNESISSVPRADLEESSPTENDSSWENESASEAESTPLESDAATEIETANEATSEPDEVTDETPRDDTDDQVDPSEEASTKQQDELPPDASNPIETSSLLDEQPVLLVNDFDEEASVADDLGAVELVPNNAQPDETNGSISPDLEHGPIDSQETEESAGEESSRAESIGLTAEVSDAVDAVQLDDDELASHVDVTDSNPEVEEVPVEDVDAFEDVVPVEDVATAHTTADVENDIPAIEESSADGACDPTSAAGFPESSELPEAEIEESATPDNDAAEIDRDPIQPREQRGLFSRIFRRKK